MGTDDHGTNSEDGDWIFARSDPGTLPTEKLPDRAEFDLYAAPLLARRERPVLPEPEEADGEPEPETEAAESEAVDPEPEPVVPSYARSGTTPNAEDEDPPRAIALPPRFADLNGWDAVRDLVALVCLLSALTTQLTVGDTPLLTLLSRIAIAVAVVGLIGVHVWRWTASSPPLRWITLTRLVTMAPVIVMALAVLVVDVITGIPVLFASLPDGPPVGVGVAVSLLLVGGIVGIEPRAHEGYATGPRGPGFARAGLLAVGATAAAFLLLSLVMTVGRLVTTGWTYSLMTFASTAVSVLVLVVVIGAALRRDRFRYVFCTAAVAGLVVGALADNTLRLDYASPVSVATGFVYLPFLFMAFAVMISRTAVRSMPFSFRRVDWIVYTLRAFEFSIVVHTAAVGWNLLAAIAAGGSGHTPILYLIDAVVAAAFVVLSMFARRVLLERPAGRARSTAVVTGVVMIIVGFLDVIVNSLATGAAAGLMTGGVALTIGIATGLMLTVPAPVRDEFGEPDFGRMFEDFRVRNAGGRTLRSRVPDVSAETARKKRFPA